MPLYRTVSDRGLWKKYKNQAAPNHFHKSSYIDKSVPIVTYSQLDLGDGYRNNSRQSTPDVRNDIKEANKRLDRDYHTNNRQRRARGAKSCPTTPGATTPTRTLSRLRVFGEEEASGRGLDGRLPEEVNGTGQFYPEDDRYSFESRSLTAYSNYSDRDSVINEPAAAAAGTRYFINQDSHGELDKALERENPFFSGQNAEDADNAVHLFLQSSLLANLNSFNSSNTNNNNNNNPTKPYPGRVEDIQSPISFSAESEGERLESSQSSTSPRSSALSTREKIRQLRKSFLEDAPPPPPQLNKPKINKYLSGGNSRATPSSTVSSPSSVLPQSTPSSSTDASCCMALSPDLPENHYMSDTVRMEELPTVHHAEVVSVRKDTTSNSESDSSSSEEDELTANIMVNIKPISSPEDSPDSNSENVTPRLEAPPHKQNIWGPGPRKKSNELLPEADAPGGGDTAADVLQNQRVETDLFPNTSFSQTYEEKKLRGHVINELTLGQPLQSSSPRDPLQHEEHQWTPQDNRSFQDTAITNFIETNQGQYGKDPKSKKKGLFSFFKKTNKKKGHDDFIQIEPRIESGDHTDSESEDVKDLYGDQSPRFHILPQENRVEPVVPMPGSPAQRNLFDQPSDNIEDIINLSQSPNNSRLLSHHSNLPDCVPLHSSEHNQSENIEIIDFGDHFVQGETDLDEAFKERQVRTLERKLSMSKPTNLDELMNEEPEQVAPEVLEDTQTSVVEERDLEDSVPDHERTQEIDIDAILGMDESPIESEEEDDSFDRMTWLNTHRNKDIKLQMVERIPDTDYYYPPHKTTTVNGETTFSASPEFSYIEEATKNYRKETELEEYGKMDYNGYQPNNNYASENTRNGENEQFFDSRKSQHQQEITARREVLKNTEVETIKKQHDRLIAELTNQHKVPSPIPNKEDSKTEEPKSAEKDIASSFIKPAESANPSENELNLEKLRFDEENKMLENVIKAVLSPKEDEFKLEELRLEEEHRMLSSVNLALQEQLEAKEMERLKEKEHIMDEEHRIAEAPVRHGRQKPKSIFNFDNFKRKEMKKDEIEEINPRVQSMPKQKSKSGFSFFSSKERRREQESNTVIPSNNSSSEDDSNKNSTSTKKDASMISSSVKNESIRPQTAASPNADQETLEKSRFLAESIVSELKRSTVNLSSSLDDTPEPTEAMKPHVSGSYGENMAKDELPRQETQDPFNLSQRRSDSKSRFSIRKPKKKENVEPSRKVDNVFGDNNTDDVANDELNESRSRPSTPSHSRPESRGRRDKPSGIAEMFGLRSSKRDKSAERPKSSFFSGSKSPGATQKRPKSSDMTQPQQKSLIPHQKEKNNLSNYFSSELSEPPHGTQDLKHSKSDFALRNEQHTVQQPASPDVKYSQIQHRPQITAQRPNLGRPPQPPNINTRPAEQRNYNKEDTPNRIDPVLNDRPTKDHSPQNHERSEPVDNPSLAARRQTGRQSGRFRKSSGPNSHETSMNTSMVSQGSNDAQSRFMESLVAAPELRSQPGRGGKAATVGRAEGARIMRGEERRAAPPGGGALSPARSEESIRDMVRPRAGSRAKGKKAGECSVM